MTKLIRFVATIVALFFLTSGVVIAQPPCEGEDCPPPDPGGDPDVPFTGLEYLLISGGVYGGMRLLKKADKKAKA